ncbi:hypothetical protein P7C70_g8966, partial [Phenoliferia sp. Uapishka_3]
MVAALSIRPRLSAFLSRAAIRPSAPPPPKFNFIRSHPTSKLFTTSVPPPPRVLPHILFCVGLSTAALSTAIVLTNSDTSSRLSTLSPYTTAFRGVESSLTLSRTEEVVQRAKKFVKYFGPDARWPTILAENWVNLSEGQRTCMGIIGVHLGIYAVWQIPMTRAWAAKWLWHHPLVKGRFITHLTSVFSHRGLLHLGFNSLALYSIAPPTISYFQRTSDLRSTSRYEFVAIYLTAGLLSSLSSHLFSILYVLPRLSPHSPTP